MSIEVSVHTYEGVFKCSAPSGKSTGKTEVACYNKNGIKYSMELLRKFCKTIEGQNLIIKKIDDIKILNEHMIRFEKKFGKLGGNVWYSLEGAFLRAAAADTGRELWEFINDDVNNGLKPKFPMPVGNTIGGGLHSKKVNGKRPDFQEFLLIGNEKTFGKAVTKNFRAYEYAKKLLAKPPVGSGWSVVGGRLIKEWRRLRNDEGAWMTSRTNEEVLEIMERVSRRYGLKIGLDIASGSFYDKGYYNYENKKFIRDKLDQVEYVLKLIKKFGIFYIEDSMYEEDFASFKAVLAGTSKMRGKRLVVGDDLTTTHLKRLERAFRSKSINAIIIKPNQVGSILEVRKVVDYCKKKGIVMIFSHRSGETMDDILGDYVVGFGGDFLKAGIYGKERLVKLKRVMDIERSVASR